ncbi:MAG: acyl transferase [Chitinophagaceae bacterium]
MQYPRLNNIFSINELNFSDEAFKMAEWHYKQNEVYKKWCNLIHKKPLFVNNYIDYLAIPFLPIAFFKTHQLLTNNRSVDIVFESSGTTKTNLSKHFVSDLSIYEKSFIAGFEAVFGSINNWCILGLLPAYLERQHSSLVYMVNKLISLSNNTSSGFYLYDYNKLQQIIQQQERAAKPTLVFGVTFALLDFAEAFRMQLKHTLIMDTGGMKGRKKEITREEVNRFLQKQWNIPFIYSEYGMTELLSQAYAKANGRYVCPPWMKVVVRQEDNPLEVRKTGKGLLNIIDLANVYSMPFIATDDIGIVHEDGSFEVLGRLDNADLRGCSLLLQ